MTYPPPAPRRRRWAPGERVRVLHRDLAGRSLPPPPPLLLRPGVSGRPSLQSRHVPRCVVFARLAHLPRSPEEKGPSASAGTSAAACPPGGGAAAPGKRGAARLVVGHCGPAEASALWCLLLGAGGLQGGRLGPRPRPRSL